MKIVAIIPAYNEENRIAASISDAIAFVDDVVVVDDCSRDKTRERASTTSAYVLHHVINRGQGAALQTGMDFALRHLHADILVHFDADGQMQGSDIPALIAPIEEGRVDVAMGSRFLGTVEDLPFSRRCILKGAILFTFLVSGLWLTDTHNGFRALSRMAAERIRLTQNRMAHASEILDQISAKKLRYQEIPVTIRYSAETLAKGQKNSAMFRVAWDVIKGNILK